jgi:hypothetical protein
MVPARWVDCAGGGVGVGELATGILPVQAPSPLQNLPLSHVPHEPPHPSSPQVLLPLCGAHAGHKPQGLVGLPQATPRGSVVSQRAGQHRLIPCAWPKRGPLPCPQRSPSAHCSSNWHGFPAPQTAHVPPQPSASSPPQALPAQSGTQGWAAPAACAGCWSEQNPQSDAIVPQRASAATRQPDDQQKLRVGSLPK